MKHNLISGIISFIPLLFMGCERGEDETPRLLRITDITPGMTLLGSNTLNTAVIGDTMTIRGEGFSTVAAENTISVQGVATPILTASATQLQATVPAGVPFSYVDVVVSRPGYPVAEQKISVRATPSPRITGMRPTQGPVGSVVTIYGQHLLELVEANQFAFTNTNGQIGTLFVRPMNPVMATADSLQITVPAGAGTGKISFYAYPAQDITNSLFSVVTPVFTVRL